jgi:subtilase family serine protease
MDTIEIEVLPNGSIKMTTDKISGANHTSADAVIRGVEMMMGGKVTRKRRIDINASVQEHDHDHNEHTHTH